MSHCRLQRFYPDNLGLGEIADVGGDRVGGRFMPPISGACVLITQDVVKKGLMIMFSHFDKVYDLKLTDRSAIDFILLPKLTCCSNYRLNFQ